MTALAHVVRTSPSGPNVEIGDPGSEGRSVLDYLTSHNTLVQAINEALADPEDEATEIYFPPGVYPIDGAVLSAREGKTLRFVPGSVLLVSQGGSIHVTGRNTTLLAPLIRYASVVSGEPVILTGEDCYVWNARIENLVDNIDLTALRIEGEGTTVQQISIYSEARSLSYAIFLESAALSVARYVTLEGVYVDLGDPTVAEGSKTYDAIIYMKSQFSVVRDYTQGTCGGRTLFPTGVIVIEGQKNVLENVYMFLMSAATYAVVLKANSEYLEILGSVFAGRNGGTYQPNSVGILCEGNFAGGHLKMFQTAITGFNVGMRFQGGADSPCFVGVSIANNNTYGIEIDTDPAGGLAISSWSFVSCYLGDVTQLRCIHFISGTVAGMQFDGCQIGIGEAQIGFVVETGFTSLAGVVFSGCRILGASGGASEFVFQPTASCSTILFINNALHSIAAYGTGAFATKCMDIFDPTFVGLTVGGATNLGSISRRITSMFNDLYTANFGTVNAGATVALAFTFTGVPTTTTAQLVATLGGALGAKAALGILFQWTIDTTNTIAGYAYNPTLAPILTVSGGIRFGITVFGGGA